LCPHPAASGHPGAEADPHGRAPQAPHPCQTGQRIRLRLKDQLATLFNSAEMLTFDSSINLFYTIKFRKFLQPCAHTHLTMNYQLPRHQLLVHSAVGTSTPCVKPSSIKSSSPPSYKDRYAFTSPSSSAPHS
jgi:hypothetical protein